MTYLDVALELFARGAKAVVIVPWGVRIRELDEGHFRIEEFKPED